jgi:hypothetical protein
LAAVPSTRPAPTFPITLLGARKVCPGRQRVRITIIPAPSSASGPRKRLYFLERIREDGGHGDVPRVVSVGDGDRLRLGGVGHGQRVVAPLLWLPPTLSRGRRGAMLAASPPPLATTGGIGEQRTEEAGPTGDHPLFHPEDLGICRVSGTRWSTGSSAGWRAGAPTGGRSTG